jgi:integrase
MGTVYRETYTKPMPPGAELFIRKGERFARWTDGRGRKRTAKVTTPAKGKHAGTDRLLFEAGTHTAKYRNWAGHVVKVTTGCRGADAAEAVLVELETRADKVRCGQWTSAEDAVLDHGSKPLAEHVAAYVEHLRTKRGKGARARINPTNVANAEHRLNRLLADCGFKRLRDLSRAAVESWANRQDAADMAAGTLNGYLEAITAFGNWLAATSRILANPFGRLPKRDAKANPLRARRALTEDELHRLLTVAQLRPLAEYGRQTLRLADANKRESKQSRRTWTKAPLTLDGLAEAEVKARKALAKRSDFIAELEHRGRERALIYKTLVLTGLRKGELASLTVGQLELDGPMAHAALAAVDEKAGRGADIPLRGDLVKDLRAWLADRLTAVQEASRLRIGEAVPMRLPPDAPLFDVPEALVRILDRDLKAAGIPKRDDRGRTVDVHALRHTFGTHLSRGGVAPRTAQAAMRHSSIDLTMNIYTDPRLLDVAGALDALPALPLNGKTNAEPLKATGSLNATPNVPTLVPTLVPTSDFPGTAGAIADKAGRTADETGSAVSGVSAKRKAPLATAGILETKGLEPSTFALRTRRSPN